MIVKAFRITIIFFVIGILLLILSTQTFFTWTTEWKSFSRDLSFAVIIASIILGTIEFITKNELVETIGSVLKKGAEEIRRAEFAHTLSYHITSEIFDQIDKYLIQSPYLMKDMKVNLEFKPINQNCFKLIDVTSFKVSNLTNVSIHDELEAFDINELSIEYPDYPKLVSIIIDREDKLDELIENRKVNLLNNRLSIKIPMKLAPKSSTEICFTIEKYVRSSDSDIWNVTYKTLNLSICCTIPEDLHIDAYPIHPDFSSFKSTGSNNALLRRWDLECGILPYQGIQISWKKTNDNFQ